MFKRKIKLMAAMLSLVILVACVGDTFSKYTAQNSTTLDMDIEMPYSSALHDASLLSPAELYDGITYTVETTDGEGNTTTEQVTCRVLIDTNKVSIAKSIPTGDSDYSPYLRITARDNETGYCFDPFLVLNFKSDFVAKGLTGYTYSYNSNDYVGLPTTTFRYALIPYFVPAGQTGFEAYEYTKTQANGSEVVYTTTSYPTTAYDYLRVYTRTTKNLELGESFGSARFQNGESSSGNWKFLLVDMEKTNLKANGYADNGTPNWEGDVYELRLDMGEVGAEDNWLHKYDCPAGAVMYIGEIRFFASLYGAKRAALNLAYEGAYATGKDPTSDSYTYATDIMAYKDDKTGEWTTMTYEAWLAKQAAGSS